MNNIKTAFIIAVASVVGASVIKLAIGQLISISGIESLQFLLIAIYLSSYFGVVVALVVAYRMFKRKYTIGIKDALLISVYFFFFYILSTIFVAIIVGALVDPMNISRMLESVLILAVLPFAMTAGNASTTSDIITKVALSYANISLPVVTILYLVPHILKKVFKSEQNQY